MGFRNSLRIAQKCLLLASLLGLTLSRNLAFAQNDDGAQRATAAQEAAREAARQRQAEEEARRAQQRSIDSMREFLNDTAADINRASDDASKRREIARRGQYRLLQDAFTQLSAAAEEFRQDLGFRTDLKLPAKKMGRSADAFLGVVKDTNRDHPRFDSSEFKDYTASELAWEALTTAERIIPDLNTLVRSERDRKVDIGFLQSLPKLELDLRRLQWMTRRLNSK